MQVRSSIRRKLGAVAIGVVSVATGVAVAMPAATAGSGGPDALAFVPTSASGGRIWLGGASQTVPLGPHAQAFAGHFNGDTGGDLFLYNPGSAPDGIVHLGSGGTTSTKAVSVGGTYRPLVGDFDGNGVDDVFWYAPGAATDSLWRFNNDGSHTTVAVNVGGTYLPTVLDANGDGRDDILWYGPGSVGDSIWLFGPGATTHVNKAVSIGGSYQIVAGEFGVAPAGQPKDRAVFYNPSGADYFWTFDTAANHTSATLPALDGNYQLFPGQFLEETYGSMFFYGPGSLKEVVWAFGPGTGGDVAVQSPEQVSGTYTVHVGDYDANGLTDMAFSSGSTTIVWKTNVEGSHTQVTVAGLSGASVRTIDMI